MKLSDYVIQSIEKLGVKHVFYLPGGGAMHLNDSLGKSKIINPVCMLHEQAASIAAEAYARVTNSYGVCMVTSGPGGTNALTGLAGAWLDSTPVIFISGQVKRADLINDQGIRQFGIQEIDITSIVAPMTKYSVRIMDSKNIRYEIEKSIYISRSGRPGPVWIDIPLDIQAEQIDESKLTGYSFDDSEEYYCKQNEIDKIIDMLNLSEKPALLVGNGVRLSGAEGLVRELYEILNIPVLTTWNGVDLIEDNHPLFYGRPGAVGQRHANFIQQNADFFLSIGTRLNLLSTGFNYDSFLKNARHVMVDIDINEMKKVSVHPELSINCDAKDFIIKLIENKDRIIRHSRKDWFNYCSKMKIKYPLLIPEQQPNDYSCINTYKLINEIAKQMTGNDIYQFTSSGTGADIAMQMFKIKLGQRAFLTKGLAAMGFDLPACIGSSLASDKRVVCVTGDGGFMMNIQELETLRRLNLNIKIFILDNCGYSMIYGSQFNNFSGRLTGCTQDSGLTVPNIKKVSEAFDIQTFILEDENKLTSIVCEVLNSEGPAICCVKSNIAQRILPRQTNYILPNGQIASRPLEDMSPLLEREELIENMISGVTENE